jgi:hypothetical protein
MAVLAASLTEGSDRVFSLSVVIRRRLEHSLGWQRRSTPSDTNEDLALPRYLPREGPRRAASCHCRTLLAEMPVCRPEIRSTGTSPRSRL